MYAKKTFGMSKDGGYTNHCINAENFTDRHVTMPIFFLGQLLKESYYR